MHCDVLRVLVAFIIDCVDTTDTSQMDGSISYRHDSFEQISYVRMDRSDCA